MRRLKILTLILSTLTHSLQLFSETIPTPTPWPERFHALTYKNLSSGGLQIADQWYDWPRGRNVYKIQKQLGDLLFNVEWNNGTSFYYTLGENGSCDVVNYGIGIPRPDFLLDGSHYLGTRISDGFLCNVWEKVDLIWYYEDVHTKKPVRWDFSDARTQTPKHLPTKALRKYYWQKAKRWLDQNCCIDVNFTATYKPAHDIEPYYCCCYNPIRCVFKSLLYEGRN